MAAQVGTIQIPLYTRFGDDEHEVGILTLPVTVTLDPLPSGDATAVLRVDLSGLAREI